MDTVTEWFMVRDDIWSSIGLHEHDAVLCVGCLERMLGRELVRGDFADVEINEPHEIMSDRLLSRLGLRKVYVDEGGEELAEPVPDFELGTTSRPPPLPEDEEWFGADRAARYLDVPLAAVFRLARDRRIVATWHPFRVRRDELDSYLRRTA